MFDKRSFTILIAGSFFAIPSLFMAMEPAHHTRILKNLRQVTSEFTRSLQTNNKNLVSEKSYQTHVTLKTKPIEAITNLSRKEKATLLLKVLGAPMIALTGLLIAKKFSTTSWSHIISNKKAAFGKYLFHGSVASLLAMNLSSLVNYTGFNDPFMVAGIISALLLLMNDAGQNAYTYLNDVLESPSTTPEHTAAAS